MNNTQVFISLLIVLIPAVVNIIGMFSVRKHIKEIHVIMNSRFTELLRITRAEGVQEGKDSQILKEK